MLNANCIYGSLKVEEKPSFSILLLHLDFITQEHMIILLCVSDLMQGHQLSGRFSPLQSYISATCTLDSKRER